MTALVTFIARRAYRESQAKKAAPRGEGRRDRKSTLKAFDVLEAVGWIGGSADRRIGGPAQLSN
jgi:hypothetical protein